MKNCIIKGNPSSFLVPYSLILRANINLPTTPTPEISLPFLEGIHFLRFPKESRGLQLSTRHKEYQDWELIKVHGLNSLPSNHGQSVTKRSNSYTALSKGYKSSPILLETEILKLCQTRRHPSN